MSNIRDLARHLNVSIGTVSRALNARPDVSASTRDRVLAAAADLGYSPNQSGRSLRQGVTGMIAAMIPTSREMPLADTIFMTVLDGLRACLADRALDLVVLLGPQENANAYLRRVVERRLADGFIISDTQRIDPRITYLLERSIPFVAFGRSQSAGSYPWIDLDIEGAAESAVGRLAEMGHRRIALATRDNEINYGYIFVEAFKRALRRRQIAVEPEMFLRGANSEEGGYHVGEALLDMPCRPTAIVLAEDAMAVGLYRRLTEAGVAPGRDLAIIGFQERPSGRFLSPKLTCFRTPLRDLGVRLGEALLATMPAFAGASHELVQARWPMELVVGESDLPPPAS